MARTPNTLQHGRLVRLAIVLLLGYAIGQRLELLTFDGGAVLVVALSRSSEVDINVWMSWPPQVVVWRQEAGVSWQVVP